MESTITQNTTETIKSNFVIEQPHQVVLSNSNKTTQITEIATRSGLIIERGHTVKMTQQRRNLKDLFANLQVGDIVTVTSLKEAVSLSNSMRYRGWKGSIGKQPNNVYKVQRIA
jgi:hypothetical protein